MIRLWQCAPLLLVCMTASSLAGETLSDPQICPYVGTQLVIAEDTFIELSVQDNKIWASIVDGQHYLKEMAIESVLIVVRDPGHRQNKWRTLLKPESKFFLTSPRSFHGPNQFYAKIIVHLKEDVTIAFGKKFIDLSPSPNS